MSPEELKEIIKITLEEVSLRNSIILAIIPVIATAITAFAVNVIYDVFKRKNEFKKKYNVEELKGLYIPLYCMISQSEYIRKTVGSLPNVNLSIKEAPYIHITKKSSKTILNNNEVKHEEFIKDDELTKYDENAMVNLVIDNCRYATTKLIKLAIAYRFLID